MELSNPDVWVEFADAPEGQEYVNVVEPDQVLRRVKRIGWRNTLYILEGSVSLHKDGVNCGNVILNAATKVNPMD